jgi:hypothetical protein
LFDICFEFANISVEEIEAGGFEFGLFGVVGWIGDEFWGVNM